MFPCRATAISFLLALPAFAAAAPANHEFFERRIRPLLAEHCYECHSDRADELKGDLRLDTRAGWEMGGKSGQVIRPGDPAGSLLIKAVRRLDPDLEMPPKHALSENEVALLAKWVRLGAPAPRAAAATPARESSPGDPAAHWAFQPPRAAHPPAVADESWPRNVVDRFLLAAMEKENLRPVADADPRTLIRRLSFDLTGLPPAPGEIEDFVNSASRNPQSAIRNPQSAIRNLVDRLLASPRFGERWARHWLDVARFAESSGHERNFTYPHAWRYRDWVIRAFNEDKPYDRFVREQVAGDLLPAADRAARVDQSLGAAFLAIGPKNHLGRGDQHLMDLADDQIDTMSKAVLGLTIACARCHDHKYDPISTADYYALAGIFTSTESLHGTKKGKGAGSNSIPADLFLVSGDPEKAAAAEKAHNEKILAETEKARTATQAIVAAIAAHEKDPTPGNAAAVAAAKAAKSKATARLAELQRNPPRVAEYTMSARDREDPADTAIRVKGAPTDYGDVVPRGFPAALTLGAPPAIEENGSGRRALAEWLTSRDNPLTARVIVNRVWLHLFGKGIVDTPDNFGTLGAPPSHPALLDHLAVRFMEEDWSLKKLIRTLVTSRAYGLASTHDPANHEIDPAADFLWRMRPRRLEAEPLRDAVLAVSGQLAPGPPPAGSVVAEMGDGCLSRQVRTDPLSEPRPWRSVYLPVVRFYEPEMFQTFDGAPATLSIGRREVTNVPAQALFLLNNEFIVDQSRHAARALLEDAETSDATLVARAFERALGRPPTPAETSDTLAFLASMEKQAEADPRETAWAAFFQALFNTAEFRHVY